MTLDEEFVTWVYRALLGREPENKAVVQSVIESGVQPSEYVRIVLTSEEFRKRYPSATKASNAWVWAEVRDLLLRVNLDDAFISWLAIHGIFEPAETAFVESHLGYGDVACDIGANIGYYTILFASLVGSRGKVYSFEPMPKLFDSLKKSVERNALGERVFPFNVALAEKRGEIEMIHAPQSANWGGATFNSAHGVPPGHETIKVEVGSLTDFCSPERLDLVKIDVEGAEPQVILGCRQLLSEYKPVVLSELHVPLLRRISNCSADEYVKIMSDIGYECNLLTETGDIGPILDTEAIGEVTNVVFSPRERPSAR
jgi:FkbM family methyltransferase